MQKFYAVLFTASILVFSGIIGLLAIMVAIPVFFIFCVLFVVHFFILVLGVMLSQKSNKVTKL
jgi:hypothetical protein